MINPRADYVEKEKNRLQSTGSGYLETPREENYETDQKEDCFLRNKD